MSGAVADLVIKTWWKCENCRTTIGEKLGLRLVVVLKGEEFNFPLVAGMIFTCRKCGHPNTYQSSC